MKGAGTRCSPSFYGVCGICWRSGGLLYGLFLTVAGIPVLYQMLNFALFSELIVVLDGDELSDRREGLQRDHHRVCSSGPGGVLIRGWVFIKLSGPSVAALLAAVCFGYEVC